MSFYVITNNLKISILCPKLYTILKNYNYNFQYLYINLMFYDIMKF